MRKNVNKRSRFWACVFIAAMWLQWLRYRVIVFIGGLSGRIDAANARMSFCEFLAGYTNYYQEVTGETLI